jgi:signal transduction histidine kinase
LGSEMRFDLVRIGKEALTNVLKHSRASTVRIELTYTRRSARLCVLDNGCGFEGEHVGNAHGGFGLFGLKTRVEHVGGKFTVQSRRGRGTRVVATVPLAA